MANKLPDTSPARPPRTLASRLLQVAHFLTVSLLSAISIGFLLSPLLSIVFSVQEYFAWLQCRVVEHGVFPGLLHIWIGIAFFVAAFFLANRRSDTPLPLNRHAALAAALLIFGHVLWLGSYAVRVDSSKWRWETIERDDPSKVSAPSGQCIGRPPQRTDAG